MSIIAPGPYICYRCEGTKVYKGETCPICNGTGEVTVGILDHIDILIAQNQEDFTRILRKLRKIMDKLEIIDN